MNNTFDVAIGNDVSDTILIRGIDDEIKSITKEEFKEYKKPGEALIYDGENSTEVFKELLKGNKTFTEALYKLVGYKFRSLDELSLIHNWSYINYNNINEGYKMISNGIVRENEILAGAIKVSDIGNRVLKGSVLLSNSDKGYFIHTPKDYYLSSNFYDNVEDIPQNIIDIMDDLYNQYKNRMGEQ